MKSDQRKKIGIWLTLNATFLWEAAEGIVTYAREHTDWRLFGRGLGVTEPLEPGQRLDGAIYNLNRCDLDTSSLQPGAPCVKVGTEPKPWDDLMVFQDHWAIGRMGAEHLIDAGLPRLAYCGSKERTFSAYRREGFLDTARKRRIPVESFEYPLFYNPTPRQWRYGIQVLTDWVQSLPTPCGVMACSDLCAAQISLVAESIGRKIPEELSLIGVNKDKVHCSITTPHLSSIAFSGYDMGFHAASLLDAVLCGRPFASPVILPPGKLVARESSAYIPIENPTVRRAVMKIHMDAKRQALQVKDLLAGTRQSRRIFERQFRDTVGHSPKEEILRVRLGHAKARLREPGSKISEIAGAMGFSSPQEFSRFFKNATGRSPSAYRSS